MDSNTMIKQRNSTQRGATAMIQTLPIFVLSFIPQIVFTIWYGITSRVSLSNIITKDKGPSKSIGKANGEDDGTKDQFIIKLVKRFDQINQENKQLQREKELLLVDFAEQVQINEEIQKNLKQWKDKFFDLQQKNKNMASIRSDTKKIKTNSTNGGDRYGNIDNDFHEELD